MYTNVYKCIQMLQSVAKPKDTRWHQQYTDIHQQVLGEHGIRLSSSPSPCETFQVHEKGLHGQVRNVSLPQFRVSHCESVVACNDFGKFEHDGIGVHGFL